MKNEKWNETNICHISLSKLSEIHTVTIYVLRKPYSQAKPATVDEGGLPRLDCDSSQKPSAFSLYIQSLKLRQLRKLRRPKEAQLKNAQYSQTNKYFVQIYFLFLVHCIYYESYVWLEESLGKILVDFYTLLCPMFGQSYLGRRQ